MHWTYKKLHSTVCKLCIQLKIIILSILLSFSSHLIPAAGCTTSRWGKLDAVFWFKAALGEGRLQSCGNWLIYIKRWKLWDICQFDNTPNFVCFKCLGKNICLQNHQEQYFLNFPKSSYKTSKCCFLSDRHYNNSSNWPEKIHQRNIQNKGISDDGKFSFFFSCTKSRESMLKTQPRTSLFTSVLYLISQYQQQSPPPKQPTQHTCVSANA